MAVDIRPFDAVDEEAVVALWEASGLVRPWNDPRRDIARKLTVQPELFLVAVDDDVVVGTRMAGFDGHRGWVNYLAVTPVRRQSGIGTALMRALERRLIDLGCPKVNLQVRAGNDQVLAFYARLGYTPDPVVSLGMRLIADD